MTRFWRGVIAIGAAVVIPLGFYAYFSVKLLTKIGVKIYGARIKSAGAGFIDIVITLEITNPSNASIDVEGYNMVVTINGAEVADIKNSNKKELKAHAVSLLDIPITIKYLEFANKAKFNEILKYLLIGKMDKISVNLDGSILGSIAKIPVATGIRATVSLKDIIERKEPKVEVGKIKFF